MAQARALILAVGTYSTPRRLGIRGEQLDLVHHRCKSLAESLADDSTRRTELPLASGSEASPPRTVLVVGAGLSAADCVVHLLRCHHRTFHRAAIPRTTVRSRLVLHATSTLTLTLTLTHTQAWSHGRACIPRRSGGDQGGQQVWRSGRACHVPRVPRPRHFDDKGRHRR